MPRRPRRPSRRQTVGYYTDSRGKRRPIQVTNFSMPGSTSALFSVIALSPSEMSKRSGRSVSAYEAQWWVTSHSDPSKQYKVSLRHDGTYECSCSHWKYRRPQGGCKHIKEVQTQIRALPGQGVRPTTPKTTPKTPVTKSVKVKDWVKGLKETGLLAEVEGRGEWKVFVFKTARRKKMTSIKGFPTREAALKFRRKLSKAEKARTSEPGILLE